MINVTEMTPRSGKGRLMRILMVCLIGILISVSSLKAASDTPADLHQQIAKQKEVVTERGQALKQAANELLAAREALGRELTQLQPWNEKEAILLRKLGAADKYLDSFSMGIKLQKLVKEELMPTIKRLEEDRRLMQGSMGSNERSLRFVAAMALAEHDSLVKLNTSAVQTLRALLPRQKIDIPDITRLQTQLRSAKRIMDQSTTPLRQEKARLQQILSGKSGAFGQKKQVFDEAELKYYYLLLALGQKDWSPPFIKSIKVIAREEPHANRKIYYHAKFVEAEADGNEELDKKLAFLLKALQQAEPELAVHQVNFRSAEARFLEVTAKWQTKNEEMMELISDAYRDAILLEFADVTVGIIKDGGLNPASLVFEAGYRIYESQANSFRIQDPSLSNELVDYRARVAGQVAATIDSQLATLNQRRKRYIDEARFYTSFGAHISDHVANDHLGELQKIAIGTGYSEIFEKLAENAIGPAGEAKGMKQLFYSMTALTFNPDLKWGHIIDSGVFAENGLERTKTMLKLAAEDQSSKILTKLKNSPKWTQIGVDVGLGLAVTAVKEIVKSRNREKRAKLAAEMALLDIEWMLRRSEYQAKAEFWRNNAKAISGLKATIGKLFEEKYKKSGKRTFQRPINKIFSTTDSMEVELSFNQSMDSVLIKAGGREFEKKQCRSDTVKIDVFNHQEAEGELALVISATSTILPEEYGLDRKAETVAHYSFTTEADAAPTVIFADYLPGEEKRHKLKVKKPGIEIINRKAQYRPGDWLDLKYKLPGSLTARTAMVVPLSEEFLKAAWDAANRDTSGSPHAVRLSTEGGVNLQGNPAGATRVRAPQLPEGRLQQNYWVLLLDDHQALLDKKPFVISREVQIVTPTGISSTILLSYKENADTEGTNPGVADTNPEGVYDGEGMVGKLENEVTKRMEDSGGGTEGSTRATASRPQVSGSEAKLSVTLTPKLTSVENGPSIIKLEAQVGEPRIGRDLDAGKKRQIRRDAMVLRARLKIFTKPLSEELTAKMYKDMKLEVPVTEPFSVLKLLKPVTPPKVTIEVKAVGEVAPSAEGVEIPR